MTRHVVLGLTLAAGIALAAVSLGAQAKPGNAPDGLFQLTACSVGPQQAPAECGHLSVAENRSLKDGRRIDVYFTVVRAQHAGAREALFMFAGGPGQGSTSMAGQAFGWATPVRADQDIVFVDQRGTGNSHPLGCSARAESNPSAAFGHVYDPEWVKQCRADLEAKADLTQYTTAIAVEDVDEIRVRLGYGKISLYGVSYGTRMAQAYLRAHANRVSAVVLDGVVPFDNMIPLTYARSAQQALDRVFAACSANAACNAAHPHPADDFAALMARLKVAPAQTTVRTTGGRSVPVKMSAADFAYALRGVLYNGGPAAAQLPDAVARVLTTNDMSVIAQPYFDRQVRMEKSLAFGVHFGVLCAEDVQFATEKDIADTTAGTFLGRYLFDEYRHACAAWPRPIVRAVDRKPAAARVPVLLVSGFFDPVTPPEFAERVARTLPNSRLIVSPLGGHGAATGCPRPAVLHLLVKRTLEGLPAVCQ